MTKFWDDLSGFEPALVNSEHVSTSCFIMTTRAAKLKNLNSTRDTLRDYVNDVKTKIEDVLGKAPPNDPDIFKAVEEDLEDWIGQIELHWIKEDETNNDILASTSEDDFSVKMLAIENYNDHRILLRNKIKRFMRVEAPEKIGRRKFQFDFFTR